jgi:N-acetylmuramic acid 6-phosphate etherase
MSKKAQPEKMNKPLMNSYFLSIDVGGTFIKGSIVYVSDYNDFLKNKRSVPLSRFLKNVEKVASPFSKEADINRFIQTINELVVKLDSGTTRLEGIGISCTGVVNYHGTRIEKATEALALLKRGDWKSILESYYSCPVSIINDNDAATIGMAELNYLQGISSIGVMTIGTGLGFSVWRNGRRWRPGGQISLLGSIYTEGGSYNELASATKLSLYGKDGSLTDVLSSPSLKNIRENYFGNLAKIIYTAAILYRLEEVYISGGLVDAASCAGLDIQNCLQSYLEEVPAELDKPVAVKVINEGNLLQLLGATSLIAGELTARRQKKIPEYKEIKTEEPYDKDLLLHHYTADKIVGLLLNAENEAGIQLSESVSSIAHTAEKIARSIQEGGRLIYVGAGTSGRIAAMDAVEIPCTYGLAKDRVIALIAGGIADASIEIESNFEEDASSVPEMLLLDISESDIVVGISASGSAYFVQSALAFARSRGAYTVMIQSAAPKDPLPFCHSVLPLHSGYEVVAGSTRMKAGTATKKMLNCLTTAAMILNGEVVGPYMTGLACINNKLIARAQAILQEVYHLSSDDSFKILQENEFDLKKVIRSLEMPNIFN